MAAPILPEKILFVDDEPEVLNSFRRQLRGKLHVHPALGGEAGLAAVQRDGPFAVVVSDLKMPGMDGVTFLGKVREQSPDTVRVMLTGFADVNAAIAAVNEGNIFRFLTKPCPEDQLIKALVAAVKQHRLVRAERELLDQTLKGSIKVLTDILALVNAQAFGRTTRIAYYVIEVGKIVDHPSPWELEAAAMLSQIGCLTLPAHLVAKALKGIRLNGKEQELYDQHPALAGELITAIPRMEEVSRVVACQETGFDGSKAPEEGLAGEGIPLGARILKVVLDFDALVYAGQSKARAMTQLRCSPHLYDPGVLDALEVVLGDEARFEIDKVNVLDLEPGMVLAEDVLSMQEEKGRLLTKGQQLSTALIMHIRNYHRAVGVKEPVKVILPLHRDIPPQGRPEIKSS